MTRSLWTSVRMYGVTLLLLGIAYPLLITGIAQVAIPHQAGGSLVRGADGRVVGSELIGQSVASRGYFHPRPSAAGTGYDALASGGSNLGPTSRELAEQVRVRVDAALASEPGLRSGAVPADMVTASGSGLDPDISPANALAQAPRVARERGLTPAAVTALVELHVRGRDLGVFGEPRVNVLALNRALDALPGVR
jgi:K+-transporting ATPase ATPase C chain